MKLKVWVESQAYPSATKAELAKALGKSKITVRSYLNGNRKILAEDVLAIESFTNKEVSRHEIRPDIYPNFES